MSVLPPDLPSELDVVEAQVAEVLEAIGEYALKRGADTPQLVAQSWQALVGYNGRLAEFIIEKRRQR